jgi:putative membrane protein
MRLVMDTAAMLARPMLANWEFPPLIVLPLIACAALYINGLPRVLRSREGQIRVFPSVCFGLGWASLFVALCSPIHKLSEELFWVHMTQHEILLLVSAPLLVLGQPTAALAWGIPGFAQPILGIRKMMSIRSIFTLSPHHFQPG